MFPASILPDPEILEVISVQRIGRSFHIELGSKQTVAHCPECGTPAKRRHSRYTRYPSDLPICGCHVRLELHVRKFFCDAQGCSKKIFCERLPSVVGPHARRTLRLLEMVEHIGLLVSGQVANCIAHVVGVGASRDSFLRSVRRYGNVQTEKQDTKEVQVIGLDDWAIRKSHSYGTIIVDLERSCPIALLEDRESATLQAWLEKHPKLKVIARDRDAGYAEACSWGAPQAEQVVDRWHLLRNLMEALERHLAGRYHELKTALNNETDEEASVPGEPPQLPIPTRLSKPSRRQLEQQSLSQQRRVERFERVKELFAQGWSKRSIAGELGLSRATVKKYLTMESLPMHGNRTRSYPSMLDEHLAYLQERWQEGCHNAAKLYREIQSRGYLGSYNSVKEHLQLLRCVSHEDIACQQATRPRCVRLPSPRTLAWWLMTATRKLRAEQESLVQKLLARVPNLQKDLMLARRGWGAIRTRQLEAFTAWMEAVKEQGFAELKRFVQGLKQDLRPILNALRYAWSNGVTEGHVNRLKMIKRSMFGRAKFDLLTAKVLYRP